MASQFWQTTKQQLTDSGEQTPKIVLQISILLQPKLAPSQNPQDSKMELHVQATLMGSTIDLNAFLVASCTLHDSHRLLN